MTTLTREDEELLVAIYNFLAFIPKGEAATELTYKLEAMLERLNIVGHDIY